MELALLQPVLDKIQGTTFASLSAVTEPKTGILLVENNARILLYNTKGDRSVYESMIKRRLTQAGKDPESFTVGDLPWGERVGNSPLIRNKGKLYLQTIILSEGEKTYVLAHSGRPIVNPASFGIRPQRTYQGLPDGEAVIVRTYNIENIKQLTLMGETLQDTRVVDPTRRSILRLNFNH